MPDWSHLTPRMDVETHQVMLNIKRYAVTRGVSEAVAASMDLTSWMEPRLGQMVVQLSMKVLGRELPPDVSRISRTVSVEVPATWWQQWKSEHRGSRLWGWLARRSPIRTRTLSQQVTLTARWERTLTLPHADVAIADRLGGGAVAVDLMEDVAFTPWRVSDA